MAETAINLPSKEQTQIVKPKTNKISRRDFLKVTGFGITGLLSYLAFPKNIIMPADPTANITPQPTQPENIPTPSVVLPKKNQSIEPTPEPTLSPTSEPISEPIPVPEKLADFVERQEDLLSAYKFGGKYEKYLLWQQNEYFPDYLDIAKSKLGENITIEKLLNWQDPIKNVVLHWTADNITESALNQMRDYNMYGEANIYHFVIERDGTILQCLEVGQAPCHVTDEDVVHNSGCTIAIECVGTVDESTRNNPKYLTLEDKSNLTDQQATACSKIITALINEGKINPNDFNILGHRNIEGTHNVDPGVDFVKRVGDIVRQKYSQITVTDS